MAQMLTALPERSGQDRRPARAAVISAAGGVAGLALAAATGGPERWWGAGAALLGAVCLGAGLAAAGRSRRRAEAELELLGRLAAGLPHPWYLLSGLTLPGSWGSSVRIWAVVAGPGGLAVLQPFGESGEIMPCGDVWIAGKGRSRRAAPSPATQACLGAEALLEAVGDPAVPVIPVVVLTNLKSIYHPARTGALVVGAPHAVDAVRRCLSPRRLTPAAVARLAAGLCQFQGHG